MKLIKYTGASSERIGRFGTVKPGQILTCTDEEAASALSKPLRFEEAEESPGRATDDNGPVAIQDTATYQLTSIRWDGNPRGALRKKKVTELNRVAAAIEQTTEHGVTHGKGVPKKELIESIMSAARALGWSE